MIGSFALTGAQSPLCYDTQVLRALSQQQLLSQTLPILVSLKHVLEQLRSPLQGALMQLLVHLVKTHRQEAEQVQSIPIQ